MRSQYRLERSCAGVHECLDRGFPLLLDRDDSVTLQREMSVCLRGKYAKCKGQDECHKAKASPFFDDIYVFRWRYLHINVSYACLRRGRSIVGVSPLKCQAAISKFLMIESDLVVLNVN